MEDIQAEEDAPYTRQVERFTEKCDARIQSSRSAATLHVGLLADSEHLVRQCEAFQITSRATTTDGCVRAVSGFTALLRDENAAAARDMHKCFTDRKACLQEIGRLSHIALHLPL